MKQILLRVKSLICTPKNSNHTSSITVDQAQKTNFSHQNNPVTHLHHLYCITVVHSLSNHSVGKTMYNRPFYQYGGHIEFIRFKEYYGMPRGHWLSIYARFWGKKRISTYISRERGDRHYIQKRHNDLFFPLQSFSRKT